MRQLRFQNEIQICKVDCCCLLRTFFISPRLFLLLPLVVSKRPWDRFQDRACSSLPQQVPSAALPSSQSPACSFARYKMSQSLIETIKRSHLLGVTRWTIAVVKTCFFSTRQPLTLAKVNLCLRYIYASTCLLHLSRRRSSCGLIQQPSTLFFFFFLLNSTLPSSCNLADSVCSIWTTNCAAKTNRLNVREKVLSEAEEESRARSGHAGGQGSARLGHAGEQGWAGQGCQARKNQATATTPSFFPSFLRTPVEHCVVSDAAIAASSADTQSFVAYVMDRRPWQQQQN